MSSIQKMADKKNSPIEVVHKGHGCQEDIIKIKNYYEECSAKYNSNLQNSGYVAPKSLLYFLIGIIGDKFKYQNLEILDVGCGTGLLGFTLFEHGFVNIDGLDVSPDMIEYAKKLKVYRTLKGNIDINSIDSNTKIKKYDLVVACGVFTLGHVLPKAVLNLLHCVKSQGLIVFTVRSSYAKRHNFYETMNKYQQEGYLKIIKASKNQPYHDEPCDCWAIKSIAKLK